MAPNASQTLGLVIAELASKLARSPLSLEAEFYYTTGRREFKVKVSSMLSDSQSIGFITCPCQVRFSEVNLYFHLPVYDGSISWQRSPKAQNHFRLHPKCTSGMWRLVAVTLDISNSGEEEDDDQEGGGGGRRRRRWTRRRRKNYSIKQNIIIFKVSIQLHTQKLGTILTISKFAMT